MKRRYAALIAAMGLLAGCTSSAEPQSSSEGPTGNGTPRSTSTPPATSTLPSPSSAPATGGATGPDGRPFVLEEIDQLDEPWAMTFLPDDRSLITGRGGDLTLRATDGRQTEVGGLPEVVHAGQGGLGDIVLAPDFESSKVVYLSWAEEGDGGTSGAAIGRARLAEDGGAPHLADLEVIWRQDPKVDGNGHYGHRLAFSPTGDHLFVSSGERQKFDPAQDLNANLGKVLRLNLDGTPAVGNPYADRGGVAAQVWSYGHRNPLGLAFDGEGRLWESEMGPQGGDEVNLIAEGKNYGWPEVSNGSHYGGADIPDHAAGDGFEAPKVWWNPSISPGSLMIYDGAMFPQWRGDAFVGALSGQALIRVDLDGTSAAKGDEWDLGQRIREVEQAPDGAIWLLTDEGQVLRLTAP